MLHVTLPPRADGDESNNYTECYFSAAVRDIILNTPGFPQEPPQPETPAHRVGNAPEEYGSGTGLALYATREIKQGELIFSERPLFVGNSGIIPTTPITELISSGKLDTPERFEEIKYHEAEVVRAAAVERMTEANKKAFMALANSHKNDRSGPATGIVRTNGFGMPLRDPNISGDHAKHSGVCNHGSRLNHRYLDFISSRGSC